jgi:hypothetical protein
MQQFMERSRKEISFASSKVDREPSLPSKLSQYPLEAPHGYNYPFMDMEWRLLIGFVRQ